MVEAKLSPTLKHEEPPHSPLTNQLAFGIGMELVPDMKTGFLGKDEGSIRNKTRMVGQN